MVIKYSKKGEHGQFRSCYCLHHGMCHVWHNIIKRIIWHMLNK